MEATGTDTDGHLLDMVVVEVQLEVEEYRGDHRCRRASRDLIYVSIPYEKLSYISTPMSKWPASERTRIKFFQRLFRKFGPKPDIPHLDRY